MDVHVDNTTTASWQLARRDNLEEYARMERRPEVLMRIQTRPAKSPTFNAAEMRQNRLVGSSRAVHYPSSLSLLFTHKS